MNQTPMTVYDLGMHMVACVAGMGIGFLICLCIINPLLKWLEKRD